VNFEARPDYHGGSRVTYPTTLTGPKNVKKKKMYYELQCSELSVLAILLCMIHDYTLTLSSSTAVSFCWSRWLHISEWVFAPNLGEQSSIIAAEGCTYPWTVLRVVCAELYQI